MNLTPTNVVVLGIGAILLYCAFKNKNPKDVVLQAFGKAPTQPPPTNKATPQNAPSSKTAVTKPVVTSV